MYVICVFAANAMHNMWTEIGHGKLKWKADQWIKHQTKLNQTKPSLSQVASNALYSNHPPPFSQSAVLFIASWIDVYWYVTHTPLHSAPLHSPNSKAIKNSTGQKLNKRCIISGSENVLALNGRNGKKMKEIQHIKCVCISIFYSFSTIEKSTYTP